MEASHLFIQDHVRVHGCNWVPVDVACQHSDNSDDDSDSGGRSQSAR